MYFTVTKRRLFTRALFTVLTFVAILLVFIRSSTLQQRFCPQLSGGYAFLSSVCPPSEDLRIQFNILEHLGGNGPWFARKPDSELQDLPLKCHIDQVHMISRHAERYPTRTAGNRHFLLLDKMRAPTRSFQEALVSSKNGSTSLMWRTQHSRI